MPDLDARGQCDAQCRPGVGGADVVAVAGGPTIAAQATPPAADAGRAIRSEAAPPANVRRRHRLRHRSDPTVTKGAKCRKGEQKVTGASAGRPARSRARPRAAI